MSVQPAPATIPHRQSQSISRTPRWGAFTLLLVAALCFLSIYQLTPPAPLPASAPATEFSAERALAHLKVIAQRPHPTGSADNERVRTYLAEQLKALGVTPEFQEAEPVNGQTMFITAAPVHNVMARLKGTDSTRAVMLVAHHDSVSTGPGATDAGSGVVTLLETLHALKAGPPLRNDVILLFTDAEEMGQLGAQAFTESHTWARDVELVLNFEGRGRSGPGMMFETNPGNRWLISQFATAAPHPVTSSFLYDVYKSMPNNTDYSEFKQGGMQGLNFGISDGLYAYHSPLDSVAELDPASLQHEGAQALALTQHFGNLDLRVQPADDAAVFFNLPGLRLVNYSQRVVLPFQVALILLFVAVLALGIRRKALTLGGALKGLLAVAGSVVAASAAVWAAYQAVSATAWGPLELSLNGGTYNLPLYKLGFAALALAVITAIYVWYRKKITVNNLVAGAALLWLLLGTALSLLAPGGSYLFQWPLLVALLALTCQFMAADPEATWVKLVTIVPTAVAAILVCGPAVYVLLIMAPISMHFALFGLLALLLGLLAPHLEWMAAPGRWLLPGAGALGAAGLLTAAVLLSGPSPSQPAPSTVWYSLNADTGEAVWGSMQRKADEYTAQFLAGATGEAPMTDFVPWPVPNMATTKKAPVAALPVPVVALALTETVGSTRTLHLRVTPGEHAESLLLKVANSKLVAATVNGRVVDPGAFARMGLLYTNPGDGFQLGLTVAGSAPVNIEARATFEQLPGFDQPIKPRPPYLMTGIDLDGRSIVQKSFQF